MSRDDAALAVVILAGGEATRLPGKLESDQGGTPLLLVIYRNLAGAGRVYVSSNRSFSPAIDGLLDCPVVIDRWPKRGPLGGALSTFSVVNEPRVFLAAGDAPFVTAGTINELLAAWEPGIEAVVPVNAQGRLEPLCALYDRAAFLAAGTAVLQKTSGGVAAAVERLHTKRVRLSNERVFLNVNTASDRQSILRA